MRAGRGGVGLVMAPHCALPTTSPWVLIIPGYKGTSAAEEPPPAQGHTSCKWNILESLGPEFRPHTVLSPSLEVPPWASFLGSL